MTTLTTQTARLQIERIIRRHRFTPGYADAEFQLVDGWFCCRVRIREGVTIDLPVAHLSPAQAKAVEVSLSMALDWIAEEEAARRKALLTGRAEDTASPQSPSEFPDPPHNPQVDRSHRYVTHPTFTGPHCAMCGKPESAHGSQVDRPEGGAR